MKSLTSGKGNEYGTFGLEHHARIEYILTLKPTLHHKFAKLRC